MLDKFGVADLAAGNWLAQKFSGPIFDTICMCGHPRRAHKDTGLCSLNLGVCGCSKLVEAYVTHDCRYFYAHTLGPGGSHALARGIVQASVVNVKMSRVLPLVCDTRNCQFVGNIWPVKLHRNGHPTLASTYHEKHVYLCEQCLVRKVQR